MWLLFDSGQIRYRASVPRDKARVSFTYLLTTIIPPNEIPGYATELNWKSVT